LVVVLEALPVGAELLKAGLVDVLDASKECQHNGPPQTSPDQLFAPISELSPIPTPTGR
jgi:hypothetical protein